ncbi:MAG: hypothetical protein Q7T30_01000 [Planctomycetota bacterium]|nr:hypothetical protein [Planctomycetota bacterium]
MVSAPLGASLLAILSILSSASAQGALSAVSIPTGSQDAMCWPVLHNVWSVTAPPYPFDSSLGIGFIVNPQNTAFALHDHQYTSPNVPDQTRAFIDYTFRWPVVVTGVEIVQHANGITRVEGLVGNTLLGMQSIGAPFGPSGDVTGPNVFAEQSHQRFHFPAPTCGTRLRVFVRKTSLDNGWANYSICPFDASGAFIQPAWDAEALSQLVTSTSVAAGLHIRLQMTAPQVGGAPYLVLGSLSGRCPGLTVPGFGVAPVAYDFFTAYTIGGATLPETNSYAGVLSFSGLAAATVTTPPGAYPFLVGFTFTHSFLTFSSPMLFSNPVSFTVTP